MSKVIYIALEDIEQRYTPMMNKALEPLCDVVIKPEMDYPAVIEKGQFLDVNKTIIFKSKQLQQISEMFYKGEIEDGDSFLVGDIFFPGIESIRYMAELQDIKVKIHGFNYAGRADENDFVQKLGKWADASELGYHNVCDTVFVGSEYHKKNIRRHFPDATCEIIVTGYIWDRNFVRSVFDGDVQKEEFVIFPHRLSPEKGLDELTLFAKYNPDMKIIVTSSGNKTDIQLPENVEYRYNLSKAEYYELMAKAKYYLSTAYQETFGYTLQEAIHYGCWIAVPNRACYNEMVPPEAVYGFVDDINFVPVGEWRTDQWDDNAPNIVNFIKKG